MHRLVHALPARVQGRRRQHAEGAGEHRRHVREDVAEHVAGHHHVELLRLAHQLHGGVVHVEVAELHVRIVGVDFGYHLAPKLRHFKHVGLVHGSKPAVALARQVEGDPGDAGDFALVVDVGVEATPPAVVHHDAARFAEVDAAGEFADDQDVQVRDQFLLQRRCVGERREQQRRAQVREQVEAGAQPQQALLRALLHRQVVPLRAAHRAEQNGVGGACRFQRLRRQRRAVLVDGAAAHVRVGEVEVEAERVEHAHRVRHDLGADAVAWDDEDAMRHGVVLLGLLAGRLAPAAGCRCESAERRRLSRRPKARGDDVRPRRRGWRRHGSASGRCRPGLGRAGACAPARWRTRP